MSETHISNPEAETNRIRDAELRRIGLVAKLFLEEEEKILREYMRGEGDNHCVQQVIQALGDIDMHERQLLDAITEASNVSRDVQDAVKASYQEDKYGDSRGNFNVGTATALARKEAAASVSLDKDPRAKVHYEAVQGETGGIPKHVANLAEVRALPKENNND